MTPVGPVYYDIQQEICGKVLFSDSNESRVHVVGLHTASVQL